MPRHFSLITFLWVGLTLAVLCPQPGFPSDWQATADSDNHVYTFTGPAGLKTVWDLQEGPSALGQVTATRQGEPLFSTEGLVVRKGSSPRETAVSPSKDIQRQRVRLSPTGSGSVSALRKGFHTPNREPVGEDKKTPHLRQTLGVDASQASGLPGVWVFVVSHYGFGKRHVDWNLNVPKGGSFETIQGGFTYKLPEGQGSLRGLMLHPSDPQIDFDAQGRIRVKILESDEPNMTWDGTGSIDVAPLDDPMLELDVKKNTKGDPELSRQVGERILNVTTDSNMGAPTLKTRVKQHAVLLVTWAPKGAHPSPSAHPDPNIWCSLGKQLIHYDEFLVEFEKGMRDILSTLQWGGAQ